MSFFPRNKLAAHVLCFPSDTQGNLSLLTYQTIFGAENPFPTSLCSLSNPLTSPENALFSLVFTPLNPSQENIYFF